MIEEGEEWFHNVVEVIAVHFFSDKLDEVLGGGDDPSVHEVALWTNLLLHLRVINESLSGGLLVSRDVLNQESVSVEPWKEDFSYDSQNSCCSELEGLCSHDWRVAEIESAGISAILLSDHEWIWVVFLTLRHLGAILSENNTVDDNVLEWSASLHGSRDNHKSIEPSSSLIETLGDEVSWETFHEFLIID
mgnify:CR=1 FL=1